MKSPVAQAATLARRSHESHGSKGRSEAPSIRINDRWRICFTWRDANAQEVEIVDYH
jgi:proteic killer suppression protein